MVIFYDVCELEPVVQPYHKDLYLEYTFMNTSTSLKLPVERTLSAQVPVIPINKMQLFHFFVDDPSKAT